MSESHSGKPQAGSCVETTFAAAEPALHEAASAATGLDDFGDPAYLDGLRAVLEGYDHDARHTPIGRFVAEKMTVGTLATRLRTEAQLKTLETSAVDAIRRPIFITGLVRTGSTALYHLIGADAAVQHLPYWLTQAPQPRPPREKWEAHPDFQNAAATIEGMYAADPKLRTIHTMTPDGADESGPIFSQEFTDDSFLVNARVPSYVRWYRDQHIVKTYERHKRILGLIGQATPNKRWILKYPVHLHHLPALLAVHPDACIVHTHRDPAEVMSSYTSLIAAFRSLQERDVDRREIAEEQLELWASSSDRAVSLRNEQGDDRFMDLYFSDFVADPVASVRKIYDRFDVDMSDETLAQLTLWADAHPQHKHGKHEHSIDEAGISVERVHDRFASYMDRFFGGSA
jgi:hypothetical protein